MAIPRVFVSSTCYDLKYIRENLKSFIKNLGYEPVLSEEGDIFYNPNIHTHDSCLSEVNNCQLFVLIVGGRYGSKFMLSDSSITNEEYNYAISKKIPVYALVEQSVLSEHNFYQKNKKNEGVEYSSVDDIKIFDFIDQVRNNPRNNALFGFKNFSDIEIYLKKQWAGLMCNYLTSELGAEQMRDWLIHISKATDKIEFYTEKLVSMSPDKRIKMEGKLYETMYEYKGNYLFGGDLTVLPFPYKPTPRKIIQKENIESYFDNRIKSYYSDRHTKHRSKEPIEEKVYEIELIHNEGEFWFSEVNEAGFNYWSENYQKLRNSLLDILSRYGYTIDKYLNEQND